LTFDEVTQEIVSEQVSLIFGENFVILIQEKAGDIFDPTYRGKSWMCYNKPVFGYSQEG